MGQGSSAIRFVIGDYGSGTSFLLSLVLTIALEQKQELQADAARWRRGEFTTKTQAREALGVRTIVDDASIYDHLKLLSALARLSGYEGLLVVLDEMVNLYKLQQTQARNANYEQ